MRNRGRAGARRAGSDRMGGHQRCPSVACRCSGCPTPVSPSLPGVTNGIPRHTLVGRASGGQDCIGNAASVARQGCAHTKQKSTVRRSEERTRRVVGLSTDLHVGQGLRRTYLRKRAWCGAVGSPCRAPGTLVASGLTVTSGPAPRWMRGARAPCCHCAFR